MSNAIVSRQNKKRLLAAMTKSLGVVTQACKLAEVDRSTFYDYYNTDEEFKNAIEDIKEVALDFAEGKLLAKINNNDLTATIFYLKCKGKGRGYVERNEIDHTTLGKEIKQVFKIGDIEIDM